MSDACRRRFDAVFVWKIDRFGRSLKHLVNALAELAALGVERYDQPEGAVQELGGRGQEPGEGPSASKGGTSVPDTEAHLRFRKGKIPGDSEEPSSTVRQLRVGEPVPAPQKAGGGKGVVSLKAV
jgi:hypothetical protein